MRSAAVDEWERCKPRLEPALEDGWNIEDVRREIEAGRAKLWPMENSAVVTRLHEYPQGRVLRIWLAGGELDELLRYLPAVDNYAREQRCSGVEVEGRPGWERVLDGYEKTRVILRKDI